MERIFQNTKQVAQNRQFCTFYYENEIFSKKEIDEIKEGCDNLETNAATTFGDSSKDIRKGRVAWIPRSDPQNHWLYQKLARVAFQANAAHWQFDLTGFWEDAQYATYTDADGGDHYDYHLDLDGDYGVQRKVSLVVQLTDPAEYEGGELELKCRGQSFTASKELGSVLLFPSFILHKVHPVTKGKRNSLVLWVSGLPFR